MSGFGRDPIPGMENPNGPTKRLGPQTSPPELDEGAERTQFVMIDPPDVQAAMPEHAPSQRDADQPVIRWLRILNGPRGGDLLPLTLDRERLMLGRDDPPVSTVDIDLTGSDLGSPPMISRRHAFLDRDPRTGDLSLTDLASTNGTWVEHVRLVPYERFGPLVPGARIRLANVDFTAEADLRDDDADAASDAGQET